MDEEDEYEMKGKDHAAQVFLRDLELEWEEQKSIPHADLIPRLMWLAATACQVSTRKERRARLLRLAACAMEYVVQDGAK